MVTEAIKMAIIFLKSDLQTSFRSIAIVYTVPPATYVSHARWIAISRQASFSPLTRQRKQR